MFAGLFRVLEETALDEAASEAPVPDCAPEVLQAGMWHAAPHGLSNVLIDPRGSRRRAGDVLCQLPRYVAPSLEACGESRQVTSLVHRLLHDGAGADRQRPALTDGGPGEAISLIISECGTP